MIRGGHCAGYGINQLRYARGSAYFLRSIHAEADLIRRYGIDRLKGAKIYLYRFNNAEHSPFGQKPMNARPCELCAHSLKEARVSRIVYINGDQVMSEKASDLQSLTARPDIITSVFLRKQRKDRKSHPKFRATDFMKD